MINPWVTLAVAGLFEAAFAFCLGKAKNAVHAEATAWYAGFVICLAISMILLVKVTKAMPVGTAYAVWTGIGAFGTVLVGILFLGEPTGFWRIFFLVTLILSVIGLKICSG